MTKQFCDCCDREITPETKGIEKGVGDALCESRFVGETGTRFTFAIKVAHIGGRGESPEPDICRKCMYLALEKQHLYQP